MKNMEAPQQKKLRRNIVGTNTRFLKKSTPRNSAFSTSIQSQLAKYNVLALAEPPTSRCKIGHKIIEKLETSSKKNKNKYKKVCRNKARFLMKSTPRNSACSTFIQSQLAKYNVLTLARPPTSRCKIAPKITEKLETSSKKTKTNIKKVCRNKAQFLMKSTPRNSACLLTLPMPPRSSPDSNPRQFSHTFEEICSKSFVILCQIND